MKQAVGHRNGAGNRVTVYERVTERITDLLKQGVVPWQKPWDAHVGPPRNGVSGRHYRGLNVFLLSLAGFDSPWWLTPRQVNGLDGHIRKGERVSWIYFWKRWLPKGEPIEASEMEDAAQETPMKTRPVLISDPKALIVAGAQAQKAADYILGWAGVEEVEAAAELAA